MFEMSQVLLPVADLDSTLAFYETVLGLEVAMRDGQRYATVRAGAVKIALATPSERRADEGIAMAFKVAGLDLALERLRERGVDVQSPRDGEHERTIEIADPDGNRIIFYEPK